MELPEIIRVIVREFPYALFGSILVGVVCAFLGVYVVARRVVFLGAVLTQVSVLGLSVTFLPFVPVNHTIGSLLVTLAAMAGLSRLLRSGRVPGDTILGIMFVGAIALRVLVLQKTPRVEVAEIETLLRGDILFVTPELFYLMLAVFVAAMGVHLLFFKEFTYISFDAETARTQGFQTDVWEMCFYLIAAVVISVATHMVGDVLVFGFLVVPAVAAMFLAKSVRGIFLVAVLIGVLAPVAGLVLAFLYDFPASPAIVAVALLVLCAGWLTRVIRTG